MMVAMSQDRSFLRAPSISALWKKSGGFLESAGAGVPKLQGKNSDQLVSASPGMSFRRHAWRVRG